jgi:type IV secretory pathway VirB3-like protein
VPRVELLPFPENLVQPVFSGVRVARSLVFCVMFCGLMFVFFHFIFLLSIVLSVFLLFTASDYTFGIFKLFLLSRKIKKKNRQIYGHISRAKSVPKSEIYLGCLYGS